MSDATRLLEARLALETATVAGIKVYRERGRIQVVGMAPVAMVDDPNIPIVKQLKEYRREIEHLLPKDGDRADKLEPPALAGLALPPGLIPGARKS